MDGVQLTPSSPDLHMVTGHAPGPGPGLGPGPGPGVRPAEATRAAHLSRLFGTALHLSACVF